MDPYGNYGHFFLQSRKKTGDFGAEHRTPPFFVRA